MEGYVLAKSLQFAIILVFLGLATSIDASSQRYDRVFSDAHKDYKRGRYPDAMAKLESIVQRNEHGQVSVVSWDNGRQRPRDWRRAFVLLASMYEESKGVEQDLDRAWHLYASAVASPWATDPKTGKRVYVGYTDAPEAPFGLCRLSQTFEQVLTFCKPFERTENVRALRDRDASNFAVQKYQSYLDTPEPSLLLVRAIIIRDSDLVAKALELGADPNIQVHLSEYDRTGYRLPRSDTSITPIWIAAKRFDSSYVQQLLASGADPNLVPKGQSATSLLEFLWGWLQQGPPVRVLAFEHLDLLLEYGYVIDVEQLGRIKRSRKLPGEFDKLLAFVPQSVRQEFEANEALREEQIARAQRERQQKIDDERLAAKAEQERREQEFRANLDRGDKSQCGYVIGIRLPMVEVAVPSGSQWFRVEDLVPADTPGSTCPGVQSRAAGNDRLGDSRRLCEAQRATCLANCDAQSTFITQPSPAVIHCREQCRRIDCR